MNGSRSLLERLYWGGVCVGGAVVGGGGVDGLEDDDGGGVGRLPTELVRNSVHAPPT